MLNVVMLSVVMLSVIILSVMMLSVMMLSVVKLNVVKLNVVKLNVVVLNVIMLSVVMQIVVAPFFELFSAPRRRPFRRRCTRSNEIVERKEKDRSISFSATFLANFGAPRHSV